MKGKSPIPFTSIESSLVDRFEMISKQFSKKTAISESGKEITYGELSRKSDLLAFKIRESDSNTSQHAIFLDYGLKQFIAILGIMKAGAAYIPIDPSWPAQRIENILNSSKAGLVICDEVNTGQVRSLTQESNILNIEDIPETLPKGYEFPYPSSDDHAHILYTSGSSGEPKGVYTNHRNQLHFVKRFSEFLNISPDDKFAYYFSVGFSAHAMPSFGILLNGGTLCMYDLKRNGFPGLANFFNDEEISLALMIPSVLRHFRMTLEKGMKFKKLRTLLIGGETLYQNDVKLIQPYLKRKTEIINIYASTEAFLARAYRMVNQKLALKQNIIPIGYPIEGMEVRIVNEDGVTCDHNQVGEMIITSPYLAVGYWNDTQGSKKDFSSEDGKIIFKSRDLAYSMPDGAIVHVGRKDAMVKIRGQRVDLGEIENILLSNQIQEVAAVSKEDPVGNKKLIAYFVTRQESEITLDKIRQYLAKRLPDFMVPSYYVKLDSLPKTESGKTDYKALPDPDWEAVEKSDEVVHARTATESDLVEIFEKQLETYPIGITDNILDSGLDSLKLFVAFDTVEKRFKVKIDIDFLMEDPTLKALAGYIDERKD